MLPHDLVFNASLQYYLPIFLWVFVAFTSAYIVNRCIRNAGVVDVFWGAGFGLIAIYFISMLNQADFFFFKKEVGVTNLVFAGMIIAASIRLTYHIGQRFIHEYPEEDPRYSKFKQAYPKHPELMTFLVYHFQGVFMSIISYPIFIGILMPNIWTSWQTIGLGLFILAWLIEGVSDAQLDQFKKQPNTKGVTCTKGLWAYSRHPNYFGQWLLWVSYAVFVTPALDTSWLLCLVWLAPALMFHFLLNVTGVKVSEEHAIQSRKDYSAYQASTSKFLLWPLKPVPNFLK